jgi:hypothetical protein
MKILLTAGSVGGCRELPVGGRSYRKFNVSSPNNLGEWKKQQKKTALLCKSWDGAGFV